jgi:hypothetical protein
VRRAQGDVDRHRVIVAVIGGEGKFRLTGRRVEERPPKAPAASCALIKVGRRGDRVHVQRHEDRLGTGPEDFA